MGSLRFPDGPAAGSIEPWVLAGGAAVTVLPAAADVPTRRFFVQLSRAGRRLGTTFATVTLLSPTVFRDGFDLGDTTLATAGTSTG